jgi:hypothetical protein
MDADESIVTGSVVAVLLVLLVTGPAVGLVDVTPRSDARMVGDGTARVSAVDLNVESFRFEPGRFGTGADYLRIPDPTVRLASVTGQPRIVYRVSMPAADVEKIQTRLLSPGDERARVSMADRAFLQCQCHRGVRDEPYLVLVEIRIQSFEVDEVVYNRTLVLDPLAGGNG